MKKTIICALLFFCYLEANKYSKDVCIAYASQKLLTHNNVIDEVFFVPTDEVKKIIVGLINSEKKIY